MRGARLAENEALTQRRGEQRVVVNLFCFLDKAPETSRAILLSNFPLTRVNEVSFCESQFQLEFSLNRNEASN